MKPEDFVKNCKSEHCQQTAFFCWARFKENIDRYPGLQLMFAIPNGGERNRGVAAQLRAEGVKAGVLDIFLPVARGGFHGLFIEMKVGNNQASTKQLEFATEVSYQGFCTMLCYSWEEAAESIKKYYDFGPFLR